MAAGDLTTVANVKTLLGAAATTGMDTLLATIVTAASQWFRNQCGRRFHSADVVWTQDGDGTFGLTLPNGPVTAVAAVIINGVSIPPIVNYGDVGWILVGDRLELVGHRFCSGTANIVISYTSGYLTIPDDLAHACTEMSAWMFKNRDHYGIQQTSTHDANAITFRKDEPPFLVRVTVDAYSLRLGVSAEGGS